MAIDAQIVRPIEHPEIPFDKLIWSLTIVTNVSEAGQLVPMIQLSLRRARLLPPLVEGGAARWEIDPQCGRPATKTYRDPAAVVADLGPESAASIAAAWDALNTIVAAVNTKHRLV